MFTLYYFLLFLFLLFARLFILFIIINYHYHMKNIFT